MTKAALKAPFPWPGGKRLASPHVWSALGDPANYVEPFFGSGAVLLSRPHPVARSNHNEVVGDRNGLLVNFWRAVMWSPDAVAEAASWPVMEADKHARACAVLDAGSRLDIDRLCGDPRWHDAELAGWWVWSVCIQIGDFDSNGSWWPDESGRLAQHRKGAQPIGIVRCMPSSSNRGVNLNALRQSNEMHVMPLLRKWIHRLATRLRHVRVIHGDWQRTIGVGNAIDDLIRFNGGVCGVFVDPPYADAPDAYGGDVSGIAIAVAEWATQTGNDHRWRIVAAGYEGDAAHGIYVDADWTEIEWYETGFGAGGYKGRDGTSERSQRERLYLSPHCIKPNDRMPTLFGDAP